MRIYTDTACDLPKSFFAENNVHLFPLRVELDGQEFDDLIGINTDQIYSEIRGGKSPKTSQVSPELFIEAFEELGKSGEEGLYIAFSSQLSGTYSTAMMIREQVKETYPELKLTIIDSKCASLGFGLVIKEAVRLRDASYSFDEVVKRVQFNADHMEHLFTVEDLDFLAKGGRVSKTSAFIGGLLSIKPLLHVEDGKLIPIEKMRGRKKVFKRILELMEERGESLSNQVIGISHGDDSEAAKDMKEMIVERFHPLGVEVHVIGSTIASHAGPGTIAVFFLNKLYENE
ncbi:DegV family protein [Kurthia zopfii]|uniref:DegV family protein n=1 Tax=Kurthia zopfii TaxID=1650 RepID=UPI000F6FCCAA|nr:DegV family protein [Kurthia zopfii]VEI04944.1 DegV domain-containing protein SAV1425 [Kurthia zopfii]